MGLLADTKRTFFDVHFWANAHRCAPGPLLSCTSSRTISDGSHGKVIFTPVPSWANRPWQMSQVACCCPVSRRPGAVGLCSGAKGAGSALGLHWCLAGCADAAAVPLGSCSSPDISSHRLRLSLLVTEGFFASLPALSNASCMLRLMFFI